MSSSCAAAEFEAIDAIADSYEAEVGPDEELIHDAVSAEVRAAQRMTRRAAEATVAMALQIRRSLPAVWLALRDGSIDVPRTRAILREVEHMEPDAARRVVARIVEDAPLLTTGQLAARIRRIRLEIDPEDAGRRYSAAVKNRMLVIEPGPDGTADLHATDLPVDRAMAIRWRINRIARSLKKAEDGRTIDQIRADVMLDLLEGHAHAGTAARLEVTVDLETLMGLEQRAAEIPGYGPVVAEIARRAAAGVSRIRYVVRRPDGSATTGVLSRVPSAGLRRDVSAAHPRCVFPGCRIPAGQCDLDHIEPWSLGGPTTAENLAPLCRHDHHRLRHTLGWAYRRTADGSHEWRSPLGLTHVASPRAP